MSGGFVSMNTSAYDIASLGGQQSSLGTEFAQRAKNAKDEHAQLATPETFGSDKMGMQFQKNYLKDDAPQNLLTATETFGNQLAEIGSMIKKAALHQHEGELENLKIVNDVQT